MNLYLNTSYVKVKYGDTKAEFEKLCAFKYILC